MGILAVGCNVVSKPQAQFAGLILIGVVALARHETARGDREVGASSYDQMLGLQATAHDKMAMHPDLNLTVTRSFTDSTDDVRAGGLAAVAAAAVAAHNAMLSRPTLPAVPAFDPNVHPISGMNPHSSSSPVTSGLQT